MVNTINRLYFSVLVEMEFKVADFKDDFLPGWRLATFADVENNMDQVKSELCGMTFHTCALLDGTVGGPGYGYQLTNKIDNRHDYKLLVNGKYLTVPREHLINVDNYFLSF